MHATWKRAHPARVLAYGVTVAVAGLINSCSTSQHAEAFTKKAYDIPDVAVAKASQEDMSLRLVLTAEFKPFQEVDVMAKVAGYVKSITVDVGDRVQQGQLLAVLEIPEMADDISRGRAALDRSQAEVARARDELQRAESSHKLAHLSYNRLADVAGKQPGLVAQQEVDDLYSKDLIAEAQVNAAKSNLASAEQQVRVSAAEFRRTQTMLDYTRVMAPFAGVVTKRYADTGSMLQAGTSSSTQVLPLVKLSENSLLRLILPVPESAVPAIHVGQTVALRVPALNRSFPGRVARFSNKISQATRTMDTEVDVQNREYLLIPGMYAEVSLTLIRSARALSVPVQAVDMTANDSLGRVALVTSGNRIEMRSVTLGIQSPTAIEIRSGLEQGDTVVVGSRAGLKQSQRIRPRLVTVGAAR